MTPRRPDPSSLSTVVDRARALPWRFLCCPAPAAPSGVTAGPGGGSGEVSIYWDVPASGVASWRVYRAAGLGQYDVLGQVTSEGSVMYPPGRIGYVDISAGSERTYRVSAVGTNGLEGSMSAAVTGSP